MSTTSRVGKDESVFEMHRVQQSRADANVLFVDVEVCAVSGCRRTLRLIAKDDNQCVVQQMALPQALDERAKSRIASCSAFKYRQKSESLRNGPVPS